MINTVLFDLDGTILENEDEWEEAFVSIADTHFIEPIATKAGWIHEPGIGVAPNWKKIVKDDQEAEQLAVETREVFKRLSEKHDVQVREGFVEVVGQLKEWRWIVGLCTSSVWSSVEKQLEELSLYLAFDVTTTGEEVLQSKPDPEIYLLTAQKLGVDPGECVVVEDSLAGVRAGKDAGMRVVGFLSDYASESQLKAAGADLVIESMHELQEELVRINASQEAQKAEVESEE